MTIEYLRFAVSKLSKNPKAHLDFNKFYMHSLPPLVTFTGFLIASFEFMLAKLQKSMGANEAFATAVGRLAKRIYPAFHLHILRKGGLSLLSRVPAEIDSILDKINQELIANQPCQARHSFMGVVVNCSVSKKNHTHCHQSLQTYKAKVSRSGILGYFGLKKEVDQACRWEGVYESSRTDHNIDFLPLLKKEVEDSFAQYQPLNPAKVKARMQELAREIGVGTTVSKRVCLCCLLQLPTERLMCGHLLCAICCADQKTIESMIDCPICGEPSLWDHPIIPDGAGYRILSLDGGMKGLFTTMLLEQVTAKLSIPIDQLFDLVVGAGSGGVIALGIGEGKTPIELSALFRRIATAYKSKFSRLLPGYKYSNHLLLQELSNTFSQRPLIGLHSPRVAVVAGGMHEKKVQLCLYSSYCPAKNYFLRGVTGSVLDVATIYGAGSTFPVYSMFRRLIINNTYVGCKYNNHTCL